MITLESLHNLKEICNIVAAIREFSETCFFDKPEEQCFTPLMNLIGEGWDKYEETHPNTPIFKNGVYVNDDSEYLGEGIVYAAKNINLSKILPESWLALEEVVAEFRYDLAETTMRYLRWCTSSPKPFMWNEHTMDWDKVYDIVIVGRKYGKTISI